MPEALRKIAPETAPAELAASPAAVVVPAQVNDNEPVTHRSGEAIGFEIPSAYWGAMIACYAIFLAALLAATGGGHAAFAIVISGLYVAMFFGTARALVRQAPTQPHSPLARAGGQLNTIFGPLAAKEVAAQMLVVPALLACFGIAIAVIRACVG